MVEVLKELCDSDGCAGSKHILVAEVRIHLNTTCSRGNQMVLKKSLSNKDSLEFVFEL